MGIEVRISSWVGKEGEWWRVSGKVGIAGGIKLGCSSGGKLNWFRQFVGFKDGGWIEYLEG